MFTLANGTMSLIGGSMMCAYDGASLVCALLAPVLVAAAIACGAALLRRLREVHHVGPASTAAARAAR
jgi:hypothetical protein